MRAVIAFLVGIIFAFGLGISGMTQTHVVRGFLDVFGEFNPSLLGVMFSAIAVHSIAYFFIKKRTSPLIDVQFHLPTRKDIDWRLFLGAAIFGVGWGLAGICPGPALVSITSGHDEFITFSLAMLGGMVL